MIQSIISDGSVAWKNMEKKYWEAKRDLSCCTFLTLSSYGNEIFLKDSFYWLGFIIVHDSIYPVRDDLTFLLKYWTSQVQPVTTGCQRPDLMLHSWRPTLKTCFLDKLEVIIIVLQLNVSSLNASGLHFVLLARILSCSFANTSAHSLELILDLLPSILLYFQLHRVYLFGTYFLSHYFSSYISVLKWNYSTVLIYYFSECNMTASVLTSLINLLSIHSGKLCPSARRPTTVIWLFIWRQFLSQFTFSWCQSCTLREGSLIPAWYQIPSAWDSSQDHCTARWELFCVMMSVISIPQTWSAECILANYLVDAYSHALQSTHLDPQSQRHEAGYGNSVTNVSDRGVCRHKEGKGNVYNIGFLP